MKFILILAIILLGVMLMACGGSPKRRLRRLRR